MSVLLNAQRRARAAVKSIAVWYLASSAVVCSVRGVLAAVEIQALVNLLVQFLVIILLFRDLRNHFETLLSQVPLEHWEDCFSGASRAKCSAADPPSPPRP